MCVCMVLVACVTGKDDEWEKKCGKRSKVISTCTYVVRAIRKVQQSFCLYFRSRQFPIKFSVVISRFLNI